jgi:Tol biopolymer transport system component
MEVAAVGGEPRELLPPADDEGDLHEPHLLPDGRGTLFVAHPRGRTPGVLVLLAGGERRTLLDASDRHRIGWPTWSPSGHVLFRRDGADTTSGLWAMPFSLESLEPTGEPFLVVAEASGGTVSRDGTLAYVHRPIALGVAELGFVDERGEAVERLGIEASTLVLPLLSPDGRRVVVAETPVDAEVRAPEVWLHDLERGTRLRLHGAGEGVFAAPMLWSADGTHVVGLTFEPPASLGAFIVPADGSAAARPILTRPSSGAGAPAPGAAATGDTLAADAPVAPVGLAADGRVLLLERDLQGEGGGRSWLVDPEVGRPPERVLLPLEGERVESARLSPDGRLYAFVSERSGREEVYLTRFPSGEGRWTVSVSGAAHPRWSRDGGFLYFASDETRELSRVRVSPGPELSRPELLCVLPLPAGAGAPFFDVAADGRILTALSAEKDEAPGESSIKIVQSWQAEFKRR